MSFFDPPQPPDPTQTARAQTGTNVSTSVANAFLNNMNQITPTGSLRYDVTGNYGWTDPSTGSSYNIPTFTTTQLLSPNQQQIQGASEQAQINMANLARQQSGSIQGLLGTNFDPNKGNFNAGQYLQLNPDVYNYAIQTGQNPYTFAAQHYQIFGANEGRQVNFNPAPAGGDINLMNQVGYATGDLGATPGLQYGFNPAGGQQYGFGDVGDLQRSFGDAGAVTRSYGPGDFSQDRNKVEEALYGRLNPQLERDRARLDQQLADQGIRYGSPAYNDAMQQLNAQQTDARMAVIQGAGQEQQRMMDMAAQRAGFENAAQQQAYQQALGRGTFANEAQVAAYQQALGRGQFYNTAQQQQYAQNQGLAQFYNAAQQAGFAQQAQRANLYNAAQAQNLARNTAIYNAQDQARQQYLTEQYAQRNQPINEITALLSQGQVSQPNFVTTPRNQISTTDIAGLINQNFAQQFANYQQQSQNANQLIGGVFGALGGLARGYGTTLSDVREKENISPLATVFASGPDGEKPLPIYAYEYKSDPSSTRHIGPMAQDVERIDKSAVTQRDGRKYIKNTKLGSILKVA